MEKMFESLLGEYEKSLKTNKELVETNRELLQKNRDLLEENKGLVEHISRSEALIKKYISLCLEYKNLAQDQQEEIKKLSGLKNKPGTLFEAYYEAFRQVLS